MRTYAYEVETLSLAELGAAPPADASRVIACDHAGTCRIQEVVDGIHPTLLERLNRRGAEGWRLAHMEVHAEAVLVVWEKPQDAP